MAQITQKQQLGLASILSGNYPHAAVSTIDGFTETKYMNAKKAKKERMKAAITAVDTWNDTAADMVMFLIENTGTSFDATEFMAQVFWCVYQDSHDDDLIFAELAMEMFDKASSFLMSVGTRSRLQKEAGL